MSSEKVGYIYSPVLVEQLNKVDKISGRSEMVNSLINSYGLFSKLRVIAPQPCDRKQLQTFHSSSYLDYLADCVGTSSGGGSFVGDDDEENLDASLYGLDHDCPIVEGLFDLCAQIGGASLTAADLLISGECKYVINWFGGWHHAKRERASGYCYVNDCVLAILRLRKRFERVLYIDLDLHHGDGDFFNKQFFSFNLT
jgi:histone deacetylase 8